MMTSDVACDGIRWGAPAFSVKGMVLVFYQATSSASSSWPPYVGPSLTPRLLWHIHYSGALAHSIFAACVACLCLCRCVAGGRGVSIFHTAHAWGRREGKCPTPYLHLTTSHRISRANQNYLHMIATAVRARIAHFMGVTCLRVEHYTYDRGI